MCQPSSQKALRCANVAIVGCEFCVVWGVLCAPEAVSAHTAAGTWPSRKERYTTPASDDESYDFQLRWTDAIATAVDNGLIYGSSYGTWFRSWLEQGETVTGVQYAEARMLRDQCVGRFESAFAAADIDVLACPAAIGPPHEDVRAHDPELLLSDVSRPITTNPNGMQTTTSPAMPRYASS